MADIKTEVKVKERAELEKAVAHDLSKTDPDKKDEFQRIVAENTVEANKVAEEASEAPEETDVQKLAREDKVEGDQSGGSAADAAKKKKVPKESPWVSPKPLDESPSA